MVPKMPLGRREMLLTGLGAGAVGAFGVGSAAAKDAASASLDDLSREQQFQTYIKLLGTLDTSDVYIWFSGVLWGVLPGRSPAPLCGFQGLARHRWTAGPDNVLLQKSYDVGFFSDLETGRPIEEIVNPLTGEKNRVFHNKYGGFEQKHSLTDFFKPDKHGKSKADELRWDVAGNQATMTELTSGQARSKMQPEDWPRETSGPVNFYAGETSYATELDHLLDPQVRQADYALFWSSFSPWEPWLLMDGAPGFAQWRATGMKLKSHMDAPKAMLDFVEKDQPNYFDDADPWQGVLSNTDRFMKVRSPAPVRQK